MAKPTNESRIQALEEKTDKILDILERMETKAVVKEEKEAAQEEAAPIAPQYPIPAEYSEVVRNTLNDLFGCQVIPMSDSPAFQFNIVVPKKYSPLTEEQLKMLGADIRAKVITYAEGTNGVKIWAEKVLNNFNPDVRALILADKMAV